MRGFSAFLIGTGGRKSYIKTKYTKIKSKSEKFASS